MRGILAVIMGLSKLLRIKPSRIKTKLDIDECLINEAKEKRKRKGERRIRLRDEGRAWQDWLVE